MINLTDIYLAILIIASFFDLVIPLFLGLKYPNYNYLIDTISTLGTRKSPVQKQEGINLVFIGILFVIFAIGQYRLFDNVIWSNNLYLIGVLAFGIGSIFAGIYPADPKGTKESLSGKIHGIASGIGFILLIFNPLWGTFISDFSTNRTLNIVLFVLGITSFTMFLISEKKDKGILKYTGLFQRINLIILYVGLVLNFLSMQTIN